ncbi:hypothetical protein AVEN_143249-1 [Araneus ventricosus]|uniref:Uncharacterized protein n=1 Tax=Araneus ventricosus TaxID=182803 RepID=A0A4Y2AFA6_ARAVE|nr:hypothetical protein AVEN_143249-1 [Araneus ventricosus]
MDVSQPISRGSDSSIIRNFCSCGGIDTALHYTTQSIFTTSWHMRKPNLNLLQKWLKRVASNSLSRQKIHNMIKLMHRNGHFSFGRLSNSPTPGQ